MLFAHLAHSSLHPQAAEAAEDVHRLVGAVSGQLKALKGGAAAVAGAASPLADVLEACLQPLAAAGGYAQVWNAGLCSTAKHACLPPACAVRYTRVTATIQC